MPRLGDAEQSSIPTLRKGDTVRRAVDLMVEAGAGLVVVANEDGSPAGAVTETDLVRRVIAADLHPWATKVDQVMTEPVVSADADCALDAAGRLMADRGIRHLAVTREQRVVGWVTAQAVVSAGGVAATSVREAMTKLLATIHFRETVREAADRMLEASIGLLLVGGRRTRPRPGSRRGPEHDDLAGLLTQWDLVAKVMAVDRYPYVTSAGEVMTTDLVTVGPDDPLSGVADLMAQRDMRHIVVVDGTEVVGLVSVRDLLGRIRASDLAGTAGKEGRA